jgi:phosphopentomutase
MTQVETQSPPSLTIKIVYNIKMTLNDKEYTSSRIIALNFVQNRTTFSKQNIHNGHARKKQPIL